MIGKVDCLSLSRLWLCGGILYEKIQAENLYFIDIS